MEKCTHTSDWHKEMRPCAACGAECSDDEAEHIGNEARRPLSFTAEQQAIIDRLEAESEESCQDQ